mgnify:CR=1 FL=1
MKNYRFIFTLLTFLFTINLGLLENFISLNDLLRDNRIYYFERNGKTVTGPVKTFWSNGYVENTGTLLDGLKEEAWEYFHDNGKLRAKGIYIKGQKDGGGPSTPFTAHVASPAKVEAIMKILNITNRLQIA